MRIIYLILACGLLVIPGCNNQTTSSGNANADSLAAAQKHPKEPVTSKLDNTGTNMVMSLVTKYYGLKNALVATKAGMADTAAMQLVVIAGTFKKYLQSDSAQGALMPYVDTIVAQSTLIPTMNDEHCERQRIAFGHISSAIYGLVTTAGLKNAGIFHQYCPMAFNEKGATWLSDESEIKNPYFGKKMMECGEVTDSL